MPQDGPSGTGMDAVAQTANPDPSGGATGTSGSDGEVTCVDIESQTTTVLQSSVPPVLEFQIDVTGSMGDDAYPDDPTRNATKMAEMQRVLPEAFASLPDDWAVGVSYFNKEFELCYVPEQTVPIAPLTPAQREALNASLQQQTTGGFTPTLAAWQFALDQVTSWTPPPPPPDYSASPRYVVLITDGVPTVTRDGCTVEYPISQQEYDYLVDTVSTQGRAAGVKTFVVGVLGSEAPQGATYDPLYMLSQVALAGGTPQPEDCVPVSGTVSDPAGDPLLGLLVGDTNSLTSRGTYCHFDMTTDTDFASGLLAAMGTIVEQVEAVVPMSCSHDVPPPPAGYFIDPEQITVTYTSGDGVETVLARSPDGSCAAGEWFVAAAGEQGIPTRIELCPAICGAAQQDVGATVSLGFGCVTPM